MSVFPEGLATDVTEMPPDAAHLPWIEVNE